MAHSLAARDAPARCARRPYVAERGVTPGWKRATRVLLEAGQRNYATASVLNEQGVNSVVPQRWLLALLLCVPPASTQAEWAEWTGSARAGTQFTENLNQAPASPGSVHKSDYSGSLSLAGGKWYQSGDFSRLHVGAYLDSRFFARFKRLDSVTPGVRALFHHKFGIGPAVPWANVFVAGERREVRSDLWDYWRAETGAELGQRFSDRLLATLRISYEQKFGRNNPPVAAAKTLSGRVMDQIGLLGTLRAEYLLTESLSFAAGYTYRYGDFTSDNLPTSSAEVLPFVGAATVDPDTFDQRLWLYRIRGNAHYASAYLSYAVNAAASVNVGYEFWRGEAARWTYTTHVVNASLVLAY